METIKVGLAISFFFCYYYISATDHPEQSFQTFQEINWRSVTVLSSKFMALQLTTDPDVQW